MGLSPEKMGSYQGEQGFVQFFKDAFAPMIQNYRDYQASQSGGGAQAPAPGGGTPTVPQTTQLPGYSGGSGQISLFGQMTPEQLQAYNQENGIATPTPPAIGGTPNSPSGGLFGDMEDEEGPPKVGSYAWREANGYGK